MQANVDKLIAAAKATSLFKTKEISEKLPTKIARYPAFYTGKRETDDTPTSSSRLLFRSEREFVVYICSKKSYSELDTLRRAFIKELAKTMRFTRVRSLQFEYIIGEDEPFIDTVTIFLTEDSEIT